MTREIRHEQRTQATPSRVWDVLAATSWWSEWNPFFRQAEGTLAQGQIVRISRPSASGNQLVGEMRVTRADPPHLAELIWAPGPAWLLRLVWTIETEPRESGCRIVQRVSTRGLTAMLFWKKVRRGMRQNLAEMNIALARQAEAG